MAQRPPPGRCVHCLNNVQEMNWDHVFPESWYPDTTPENIEKWKIPSCIKCNDEYGKMEREMLHSLGLCLNSENLAAMGIIDKVHRALDGRFGKNSKDALARDREREKIKKKIVEITPERKKSVYPTATASQNISSGQKKHGLIIPDFWFDRLSEKIVRGITYLEYHFIIEKPYSITFSALREEKNNPILDAIGKFGYQLHRGPGIIVNIARVPEDPLSSVWVIDIWQDIRMYAFCLNKSLNQTQNQP